MRDKYFFTLFVAFDVQRMYGVGKGSNWPPGTGIPGLTSGTS
jgi:hypothetical protein